MAVVCGSAFLRLRNLQRTRAALLSPRSPAHVISPYWFALSAVSALSVLVFVRSPALAADSLIVCASSLAATLIAWRMTMLGALLIGDDLAAKQLVDGRVRWYRSSIVLMCALIQPFAFMSQILNRQGIGAFAYFVPWLVWMVFFVVWMHDRQRTVSFQ